MSARVRPTFEQTEQLLLDASEQLAPPAADAEAEIERLLACVVADPRSEDAQTLRAWLGQRPRSRRQILELFLDAGELLQAAHERGRAHGFALDSVRVSEAGCAQLPTAWAQASGSPRDDQRCFCMALWEALYGVPPGVPTQAWIPTWIRVALERGMSLDPKRRFPDMRALTQALARP